VSELVDVVDADDRVVGRATRAAMRRDNLLHRAVYIVVFNSRGELFVHRRTDSKDVYPGLWDVTIGGVVAAGEDYLTAARREIGEEIGVVARALERFASLRYEDPHTRLLGAAFVAEHDGPLRLQADEIAYGAFVPLAEAERIAACEPCCPDGAAVLRLYLKRIRGE
jgi:isopentenyldiphosphate isomerase